MNSVKMEVVAFCSVFKPTSGFARSEFSWHNTCMYYNCQRLKQ